MSNRDDLFDNKIKEKLKEENGHIPDNIDQVFDETLKNLEKKKFNWKVVSGICAACISGVILVGITMPAYATDIPIIGGIFKTFQSNVYENYDKYASDLNITKESRDVKVTINNVVYDGIDLIIFYTVESEEPIVGNPSFLGADLKINGERVYFGGGETGKLGNDDKTYMGIVSYSIDKEDMVPDELKDKHLGGNVEIPEEFILEVNLRYLEGIKEDKKIRGRWNFQIPVGSEKIKGKVQEYDMNIDLAEIGGDAIVTKVITTPINTAIYWDMNNQDLDIGFYVFDDKGRYLSSKSGSGTGGLLDSGEYRMYKSRQYKEIYSDTNSLVFIPYVDLEMTAMNERHSLGLKDNKSEGNSSKNEKSDTVTEEATKIVGDAPADIKGELNLQGESQILSKDGDIYTTITRVEVQDGKTNVYFKSEYGINGSPLEIVNNKTGEKIKNLDNFDSRKLDNTRYDSEINEYMTVFDGEIGEGEYTIKAKDFSTKVKLYNSEKFVLDVY